MTKIKSLNRNLILFSSKCAAYDPKSSIIYLGGKSKDRMRIWSYWLMRNGYTERVIFCKESRVFLEWKHEIEIALPYSKIIELAEKYNQAEKPDLYAKKWKPKTSKSKLHVWKIGDKVQKESDEILTLTSLPYNGTTFVKDKNGMRNLIRLSDYQIVKPSQESHEESENSQA